LAEEILSKFGSSKKLIKSAAHALEGKTNLADNLWDSIEAAHRVTSCEYEYGTSWGTKVSDENYEKYNLFFFPFNSYIYIIYIYINTHMSSIFFFFFVCVRNISFSYYIIRLYDHYIV
jgi:hypothetical protein